MSKTCYFKNLKGKKGTVKNGKVKNGRVKNGALKYGGSRKI